MEITNIGLSLEQFCLIIRNTASLGATIALVKAGEIKPYLNKAEAFRMFGRKKIEHWITNGWITPRKDGEYSAAWRIDRIELEILAKANDLFLRL